MKEEDELTEDEIYQEKNGGVDIEIKLPRKKTTSLDMLSGGERSLVGIAALFAMVSVSPPPFLVLDEIDAPLDERNARRFGTMLKDFSRRTQLSSSPTTAPRWKPPTSSMASPSPRTEARRWCR